MLDVEKGGEILGLLRKSLVKSWPSRLCQFNANNIQFGCYVKETLFSASSSTVTQHSTAVKTTRLGNSLIALQLQQAAVKIAQHEAALGQAPLQLGSSAPCSLQGAPLRCNDPLKIVHSASQRGAAYIDRSPNPRP